MQHRPVAPARERARGVEARVHPHQHVIAHTHVAEDPAILKGARQAKFGDDLRAAPVNPHAADSDCAAVGAQDAADQVERGRLPRAVRPDDADGLTWQHLERKAIYGPHAAETLDQVVYGQQRFSGRLHGCHSSVLSRECVSA